MPPKKAANAAKKPPSKTTKAGAPTKKSPATKPSDKPKEKPPATKPSDKSKEKAPVKPKDKDTAKATEEQAENTTTDELTTATQQVSLEEEVEIGLKEIADVSNNKHEKVNQSNRWPLVVDSTERVSAFLRHRDCNYVDALDQKRMEPDSLRLALLGAIRFGKPMVMDLMGSDVWGVVETQFQELRPGLLESVLDKSILQEDRFFSLVNQTIDGPEFTELHQYSPEVMKNFVFIILTTNNNVPENLVNNTITVKVV